MSYHVPINISTDCKICKKHLKSMSGLGSHLKNQHSKKYEEYLLEYENIDVKKLEQEWEDGREERNKLRIQRTLANNKKLYLSPKERMTDEQYKNFRDKMSKVFTLEWFVEKYGIELGTKKYEERSQAVSANSYFKKYNQTNKNNWSKISQELFWELHRRVSKFYKQIYFAQLNHEYGCETNKNFDFVILDNKKVIEFNGDHWHANPKLYKEDEIPLKFLNRTAKQCWEEDSEKIEKAIKNGYTIKVVWESDFMKNREKIILECLDFIL